MSLKYRDKNGATTVLAGLTPGGNLETGAVATREGTFQVTLDGTVKEGNVNVTFSDAMPDDEYEVIFSYESQWTGMSLHARAKTSTGFPACWANIVSYSGTRTVSYKAFKLYEVADAEQLYSTVQDLEAMVPSNASSTNKFATINDLTGETRSLDRRIDDLEDYMPSNVSISNKVATQADLANVSIDTLGDIEDVDLNDLSDGQTLVWDDANSKWVNGQGGKVYSAGDGINISNTDEISAKVDDTSITTDTNDALKVADTYKTIFVGTQAQWDALSTADKVKYNEAHITDDVIGGEVADEVTDGLMSPVTSNAVYDALGPLRQNTSGQFILSNGLKICWGSETVTTGSTPSTSASFAYSGEKTISFPFSFTSKPTVVTNVESNPAFWSSSSKSVAVNGCTLSVAGDRATAGQTVSYIAIGY